MYAHISQKRFLLSFYCVFFTSFFLFHKIFVYVVSLIEVDKSLLNVLRLNMDVVSLAVTASSTT